MRCPTCNNALECHQAAWRNPRTYMCHNSKCPTKVLPMYYAYVEITNNWWFSSRYAISFIHSSGARYAIEGPMIEFDEDGCATGNEISVLFKLSTVHTIWNGQPFAICDKKQVWYEPYQALPVNWEHNGEFDKLRSKFDRYLDKLIVLED